MHFENVVLASVGYSLPETYVSSEAIESRLKLLYDRLKLPLGRLELMSGIRQRRFWPRHELPSVRSIASGKLALAAANVDPKEVGCLVHGSVCRDFLEPATACRVHHGLEFQDDCIIYDVSNACLGLLNGVIQVATMIELGQIKAGLVVGCESGRSLVETTIRQLLVDATITRQQLKTAIASLTIGSASAAILLRRRERVGLGCPLVAATALARTSYHDLCQSDRDDAVGQGMQPLMDTDSEQLMQAGVTAAETCFANLKGLLGDHRRITKTVCHQVGVAHRKLLLEKLQLHPEMDFVSYPWLGNTGSAALPTTLAIAHQSGHFVDGDCIGLLGIGSGINVLMLAVQYDQLAVAGAGPVGPLEATYCEIDEGNRSI